MSDSYLLLENPRRRRRRKTTARRRRAAPRRRRRRRNPAVVTASNPRRRRRRSSPRRRKTTRRRRRNPFGFGGDWGRTFQRGLQIVGAEVTGDALARVATKFGAMNLLTRMNVPQHMVTPAMRILVGLLGVPVLKFFPRVFKPDFRATFGAVNVAQGLIGMTQGLRAQLFAQVGLSDWETAGNGIGALYDYETASGGMGGYELAAPPADPYGVLGQGVMDYSYL